MAQPHATGDTLDGMGGTGRLTTVRAEDRMLRTDRLSAQATGLQMGAAKNLTAHLADIGIPPTHRPPVQDTGPLMAGA